MRPLASLYWKEHLYMWSLCRHLFRLLLLLCNGTFFFFVLFYFVLNRIFSINEKLKELQLRLCSCYIMVFLQLMAQMYQKNCWNGVLFMIVQGKLNNTAMHVYMLLDIDKSYLCVFCAGLTDPVDLFHSDHWCTCKTWFNTAFVFHSVLSRCAQLMNSVQ